MRLHLGVTGHIELDPAVHAGVRDAVRAALSTIRTQFAGAGTPERRVTFSALSSLAEGADRIVVRAVLEEDPDGARLDVVLPSAQTAFEREFETPASVEEFRALCAGARSVRRAVAPAEKGGDAGYLAAAAAIRAECDVLVAVWDGAPPRGDAGAAVDVAAARVAGVPLVWIDARDPTIVTLERMERLRDYPAARLGEFLSASVDARELRASADGVRDEFSTLLAAASKSGRPALPLPPDVQAAVDAAFDAFLPVGARADALARSHQASHFRAGTSIYVLGAASVACASVQFAVASIAKWATAGEIACLVAVLAVVAWGSVRKWHERRLDERYLAEHLRVATFLSIAGLDVPRANPRSALPGLRAHAAGREDEPSWLPLAQAQACGALRRLRTPQDAACVRDVLDATWIEGQIRYHGRKASDERRRGELLGRAGIAVFAAALACALVHAFHEGDGEWLLVAATTLPAVGAAVAAVRTQREHDRSAARSDAMRRHLLEARVRLRAAESRREILVALRSIGLAMLHETEDWRVVFLHHDLEAAS